MSIKLKLHEIKESFRGKTMAPAFNAFHTFLFTPNEVTSSGTVSYTHLTLPTKRSV